MNQTNKHYKTYRLIAMLFVVILSLGLTITALAYTWAEPPDATPGSPVTLHGDNRDNFGYVPGNPVYVVVKNTDTGWTTSFETFVLEDPNVSEFPYWEYTITLSDDPNQAVGSYTYTATIGIENWYDIGHFTDKATPELTIAKTANPLIYSSAGTIINYSYIVTNSGNVTISGPFSINDSKIGAVSCSYPATLTVGNNFTCSATYIVLATDVIFGYVANTADGTGFYSGNSITSNTDIEVATLPGECLIDSDGPNDEPGQKDLTKLCRVPTSFDPVVINWNWDKISFPGSNSGDGCALFDIDNDGLANYSLCVSWQEDRQQMINSPRLYLCNDTRSDRCAGASTALPIYYGSDCEVDLSTDDPYDSGDSYPYDAKAFCSIQLEDVGGAGKAILIDVCSYPSEQPNSDPSDCVVISEKKGNLNVIKDVVPDDSSTTWNIAVTGPTSFSDTLYGDDSTGIRAVAPESYTIIETAISPTDLTNYDTTWACTLDGAPYGSGTGTSITVSVGTGDVVVCTFTNTHKTGSLQIFKNVVPDNTATNWDFAVTGPTSYNCSITGDGFCDANTVITGSYSIVESAGSETNLDDYTTTWACTVDGVDGSSGTGITISNLSINKDDVVVCTYTNTLKFQNATVTACKVDTEGDPIAGWEMSVGGQTGDTGTDGCVSFTLTQPGDYTLAEEDQTGWTHMDAASWGFTATSGGSYEHTFTNYQYASVTACKVDTEGDPIAGWEMSVGGQTGDTGTDGCVSFTLTQPGPYTLAEEDQTGWTHMDAATWGFTATSGGSYSHTFTNFKHASVTACKVDTNGDPIAGWEMSVGGQTGDTDEEGCVSFTLTQPGPYTLAEEDQTGWTHMDATTWDFTATSGGSYSHTFTNFKHASVTACKVRDLDGIVGGETTPVAGWSVTLDGDAQVTDTNGCFTWTVTQPGPHTLTEEDRPGWIHLGDKSVTFTVKSGTPYSHTFTNFKLPDSQLTNTSYCPLPNDQFRLLYRLYVAPNTYLLNGSNPGQFYYNAFFVGTPNTDFTMTIQVPYPFMTQEGAGNPIQVHDGTGLSSAGCYLPFAGLSGFTIATQADLPKSPAGNQIITPEDYTTKQLGQITMVTISGKIPSTGMVYVTIHLDYGIKKTQPWKPTGTGTDDPNDDPDRGLIMDLINNTGFGSGPVTIHGYEVYNFSRTVGGNTASSTPSSVNDPKKFAGFMGFTFSGVDPKSGVTVKIYSPKGVLMTTLVTDVDGYYMYPYKHTAKSATYKLVASYGKWSQIVYVTVKANGFAAVDYNVP